MGWLNHIAFVQFRCKSATPPRPLSLSRANYFKGALDHSLHPGAYLVAAPIILNLILIGILFFGKLLDDQIVYYLSYGVSIAGFLQIVFLYKFVNKFYSLKLNFDFKITKPVKVFFKKLLPSIFSSGVTQINILVGTIIASFQASAVSYLYYADRIYQINLAIAGIAIGVVVLPQLSKYVQQNKKQKICLIQNKVILSKRKCLSFSCHFFLDLRKALKLF